jgi:hypothetical protein
MDRRTFIAAGTWFSTQPLVAPWDSVGESQRATRRTIAVFDSTMPGSATSLDALTRYATREGLPAFDLGHAAGADIAAFWYATLAPHMMAAPTTVLGVTRAADFFVLARLALRPGRMPACSSDALSDSAVSFALAVA